MSIKEYILGQKSLSKAVIVNIIGIGVITQLVEILVAKGYLPEFEIPRTLVELFIFIIFFTLILPFDYVVWRCADNAKFFVTKVLGKVFAVKGVVFLLFVIGIWLFKN